MYQYIRDIAGKLLVNENRLTVRQSLEIGECPDIFLVDYFFLRFVRNSFADFVAVVFQSLSETSFFDGQMEQFEVTYEIPLEFYDWYTGLYPVESGKSMFYQKKQDTMVVKFFGTFMVKDEKLYVTIPDFIMYSFVRLQFYNYLHSFNYRNVLLSFTTVMPEFEREIKNTHKSFKNFIKKNPRREYLGKAWYYNKITRYTDLEESFGNLQEKTDYTFANLFLDCSLNKPMPSLELMFTFYFVNFFLYSLVKDSPESFFDNFYENCGFWEPDHCSLQNTFQLNVNVLYQSIKNYDLFDSEKEKWVFSNTQKDFIFR